MQSTLNVPDTVGVAWGARLPKRVPGVELAEKLVLEALKLGKKVFLVGGRPGVGQKAAESFLPRLQTKAKTLIAATTGAADIAREQVTEREAVLGEIRAFKPMLVLVAYGAPWQEEWLIKNAAALEQAGVRLAMVVGGAFDIWAGNIPRAPLKWRQIGLEWLWRLRHEPWRWRRQLRLVEFIVRVGGERVSL